MEEGRRYPAGHARAWPLTGWGAALWACLSSREGSLPHGRNAVRGSNAPRAWPVRDTPEFHKERSIRKLLEPADKDIAETPENRSNSARCSNAEILHSHAARIDFKRLFEGRHLDFESVDFRLTERGGIFFSGAVHQQTVIRPGKEHHESKTRRDGTAALTGTRRTGMDTPHHPGHRDEETDNDNENVTPRLRDGAEDIQPASSEKQICVYCQNFFDPTETVILLEY